MYLKLTEPTTISISKENYCILKKMGFTGESFNDVLDRILKNNINLLESNSRVAAHERTLTSSHTPLFKRK
ncbi:MAG TPA: antitoxin VapB family protein [Nitrososphaeraceae archaeon]|nr:antitoxin VapB family protein [Nitrososphaeraceae archaeon]